MLTNGQKFLNSYNKIDQSLRAQYNLKRGQSFGDVIRRCASINSVVRRYEDMLIDYGRLRNAIVHSSGEEIIAEPHDDVVENIENICKIITTPPKISDVMPERNVLSVQANAKLKDVIELIYTSGYSNLPIYDNGVLDGVANGQKIINLIGQQIAQGMDVSKYINQTSIKEIIDKLVDNSYYTVASMDSTVEEILTFFNQNRKLLAVVLTENGSNSETVIGIITTGDIIWLNKLLENGYGK